MDSDRDPYRPRGQHLDGDGVADDALSGGDTPRLLDVMMKLHRHISVPGVVVAGDATPTPFKQILIAMGDGAEAARGACEHLIRFEFATPKCSDPLAKAA
ncbi:MAG: hypothetical protein IV100_11690 [Myxococcales bacterium]|nr:hypothetical protein [Myxococcales bacterium]